MGSDLGSKPSLHDLLAALVHEGAITITTPSGAALEAPVDIETVIHPDGDVITRVSRPDLDPEIVRGHMNRVRMALGPLDTLNGRIRLFGHAASVIPLLVYVESAAGVYRAPDGDAGGVLIWLCIGVVGAIGIWLRRWLRVLLVRALLRWLAWVTWRKLRLIPPRADQLSRS